MLKFPHQIASRTATAVVIEERAVKKVLAPISGTAPSVEPRPDLVPVSLSMKAVVAQVGTYSSLHISATTTSLHPVGDLEARTRLFHQDVNWILEAFDAQAHAWNSIRHAMGMSGDWTPSGRTDGPQS
jgi:hypothetical protein